MTVVHILVLSDCLLTPDAQLISALLSRGRGWGLEGLQGKKLLFLGTREGEMSLVASYL